jgi:hypothetical protein
MKTVRKLFLAAVLCWGLHAAAEMRTWTSGKGDTIEAEYVRMFPGGQVVLKSSNGRELKVPVSGLCEADQSYLAALVPPELEIKVDVDVDIDTEYSSDSYVRKRETSTCKVVVQKTNREPCSRTFTAHIYVFAEEERGDKRWLITQSTEKVSFTDNRDTLRFECPPAEVEFISAEYVDARGYRYDGYLVVITDESGEAIAMESNRDLFEKNWNKIKGAKENTEFDEDLNPMGKKRTSSF